MYHPKSLAGDTKAFFLLWLSEGNPSHFSSHAVTEQGLFLRTLTLEETLHHVHCRPQPPSGLGVGRSI